MMYDVAVVGAGVLGLAHAYHLARRGLRVVVFERHPRAQGASVRNFGMIWPIGQPAGPRHDLARRSREIWLDVLRASGIWHRECGSLHVAHHEDEAQVLREFAGQGAHPCEVWAPAQVAARFPEVRQEGLRAALWSEAELGVDPRQVIARLPHWLSSTHGVTFSFGTTVTRYEGGAAHTTGGVIKASRLVVCTGADFRDLYPQAFAQAGLIPCKLQMMRSQPYGDRFRLGAHLAAGLTLGHYTSFASCPTLPALKRRFDAEMPEYCRLGIHVLVSQTEAGELILGDSHEYGDAIEPFDKTHVDDLILAYLSTFLDVPDLRIAERWHGIYVKHPTEAYVMARPEARVMAVTGVGGAGMTLSFGLAEKLVNEMMGEA